MLFLDILFLLFYQWCFFLPTRGGKPRHGENMTQLQRFFFWQLRGISSGIFVAHTSPSSCFTFGSPLFTWCPSLRSPMLRCQVQLELTFMMCLGDCSTFTSTSALSDRSTFTSTSGLSDHFTFTSIGALNGWHDGSSPLFFWRTCCLPKVCVCLQKLKLSPPPNLFMVSEPGIG